MELKTPLYDCHVSHGGKMVPFAGYLLPVQYTDVIKEHMAVRQSAGIFDVSHMGEIIIKGPDALSAINHLFTNDFTSMQDGRVRYSPMCNEDGGVIDDLLVYRMNAEEYFIVVNASNRLKDAKWMESHLKGDVSLRDASDDYAQIAVQGPNSGKILAKIMDSEELPEKYYTFHDNVKVGGVQCLISQTGYTGEYGFELYCEAKEGAKLWESILAAGEEYGLVPCGLGARDTLRLEAGMPLYGHEMDEEITPLEIGLNFAVKMQKEDFIGKKGMELKGTPVRKRVGLKITGRGIAREHNTVYLNQVPIGETTSGTHCPYLGGAYAMALIEAEHSAEGTQVEIDVRGRKVTAEIIPLPFYKRV